MEENISIIVNVTNECHIKIRNNNMPKKINYQEIYGNKTNDSFAVIEKPGIYNGRLIAVRIVEQDEKFVDEGKEPKKLISFLWDVLNKSGQSCHVYTKPCTISFTDKSNLPQLFKNVKKLKKLDDYLDLIYEDGNVKDIYASLSVEVTDKDGKFYTDIDKVIEFTDPTNQAVSKITDWDKKIYGKECLSIDYNPKYDPDADQVAESDTDFFNRMQNT